MNPLKFRSAEHTFHPSPFFWFLRRKPPSVTGPGPLLQHWENTLGWAHGVPHSLGYLMWGQTASSLGRELDVWPKTLFSVGTAQRGRPQSPAAGGHLTDHMPVWGVMNKENSRAEKVLMRSLEFLAATMPEARCNSGNQLYKQLSSFYFHKLAWASFLSLATEGVLMNSFNQNVPNY